MKIFDIAFKATIVLMLFIFLYIQWQSTDLQRYHISSGSNGFAVFDSKTGATYAFDGTKWIGFIPPIQQPK